MKPGARKRRWWLVLVILLVVLLGILGRPALHLWRTAAGDVDELVPPPDGHVDDASRLNLTEVGEIWSIPVDAANPEAQLAGLLEQARKDGLKVSIAGARHSMGGHTIYPGGIVIDTLTWNHMELDEAGDVLTVGAGALWVDILKYLDARGRSVEVMQSNNSFSVGGSISVNCHGWQFGRPPIVSTVESFRLMKADGSIIRCSRDENEELFSLVLGGYGLFGIILDVELRVTRNERYRIERRIMPLSEGLAVFDATSGDSDGAQMVYGRMNVTSEGFLSELIVNRLFIDENGPIPTLVDPEPGGLKRTVFRGSAQSDYGKSLRWKAESNLQPFIGKDVFSRNQLLNDGVEIFQNRTAATTDILHEYFVPPARAVAFVEAMQRIVPGHDGNLLNVTVRSVNEDADTFLRYADGPMIAFVMLFVQDRTEEGERGMQTMTRDLIDAALEHDGCYYLPYRLHATRDQFNRAYPQAARFFALKRNYDPGELFQNRFYEMYGRGSEAGP